MWCTIPYRPPRFRPISLLERDIDIGVSLTNKIGFMGAAVSNHPSIEHLSQKTTIKSTG